MRKKTKRNTTQTTATKLRLLRRALVDDVVAAEVTRKKKNV